MFTISMQRLNLEKTQKELNDTKESIKPKNTSDKEIQVDPVPVYVPGTLNAKVDLNVDSNEEKSDIDDIKKEEPKEQEEEEDDEVFVYPNNSINEQKTTEEEEEEEDVFVYRGMDAVPEPAADTTSKLAVTVVKPKLYDEEDVLKREIKMKVYYEQQLRQLTEKIQMTDSKALRFAAMYKSLKDRLIQEDKEKQMMVTEIERLNKEFKNVQDLLATTESNYQKQVDTMTEFISSLQQNQEEQSRHHQQPQRRSNTYHNQR